MSENVCTACGGSGQQWSGVEYMGTHEIVGCDECWGTGFEDVAAGVDDLRALLAQRDGELEALRERVDEWEVFGEFAMEGAAKSFLRGIRPAALSDNQEPDALTYDEIVELAKTNPGLERFYGVDLDDDDLPDNPESPALTDKEA